MMTIKPVMFFTLIAFFSTSSVASSNFSSQKQPPVYYSIVDPDKNETDIATSSTLSFFTAAFPNLKKIEVSQWIDLLKWKVTSINLPSAETEKYNRKQHFGRWINDPADETCFNTRAQVLIRDSQSSVSFRHTNKCIIDRGEWFDPYSENILDTAGQIDIDHMVPLKNAYESGAWKWHFKSRCLYANYMGLKEHLVPVSKSENRSKGDSSPADYLPSANAYICDYIKNWLTVKSIWNLKLSDREAKGIDYAIKEYNCDRNSFTLAKTFRAQQHQFINDNIDLCDRINSGK